MFYSHTHLLFNFLIAINKSSQNESGIATIRHTNSLSPLTMKFKNNFIGKTKLHHSLSISLSLSALGEAEGRIRLRLVA